MFMTDKKPGTYQGCMLGCAVGDAVGAPVEKQPDHVVRAYVEAYVRPLEFEHAPPTFYGERPFGHYTDDTQFMYQLALSLVSTGAHFDVQDYADRLLDLYRRDQLSGMGGTTHTALGRLSAGSSWRDSGDLYSAGNGACTRATWMGLVYGSSEEVAAASKLQSVITHASHVSQICSVVVGLASFYASRVLLDVDMSAYQFMQRLSVHIEDEDEEMAAHLRKVAGYLRKDVREMLDSDHRCMQYLLEEVQSDTEGWPGISPYCVSSTLWALYAFLKTPYNFWATIQCALLPGGDVDSIAALAGALSGIHNGSAQMPLKVLELLTDEQGIGSEELLACAYELEAVSQDKLEAQAFRQISEAHEVLS